VRVLLWATAVRPFFVSSTTRMGALGMNERFFANQSPGQNSPSLSLNVFSRLEQALPAWTRNHVDGVPYRSPYLSWSRCAHYADLRQVFAPGHVLRHLV
jgi:hypothetical protein